MYDRVDLIGKLKSKCNEMPYKRKNQDVETNPNGVVPINLSTTSDEHSSTVKNQERGRKPRVQSNTKIIEDVKGKENIEVEKKLIKRRSTQGKNEIEDNPRPEVIKRQKVQEKDKNYTDVTTRPVVPEKDKDVVTKERYNMPKETDLTLTQKKQRAYLMRMQKINRTPRRMKKGKNRHIRCDQGKPTGRTTPWAQALKLAKEELQLPTKGVMIFPRIGTELHTSAVRIMHEMKNKETTTCEKI